MSAEAGREERAAGAARSDAAELLLTTPPALKRPGLATVQWQRPQPQPLALIEQLLILPVLLLLPLGVCGPLAAGCLNRTGQPVLQ